MEKLIVIRGPSGSGKSTVARELIKKATRPTLLVSEDQVRKMFSDHRTTAHPTAEQVARTSVLTGLRNGYDVVYEGILNMKTTGRGLSELFEEHKEENYLFYLDVSYEETLKRHQTRPKKAEFKVEAMKKWRNFAAPAKHTSETLIPESSSLGDTIKIINQVAGLGLSGQN